MVTTKQIENYGYRTFAFGVIIGLVFGVVIGITFVYTFG